MARVLPQGYSYYVKLMKVMLPVGIVASLGVALGWPFFMALSKEEVVALDTSQPEIRENRMVRPHYVSTDEKGQPFHVDAAWAKQNPDDNLANLTNPSGSLTMEEGETFDLKANEGRYDSVGKALDLKGKVTLVSTNGYHVQTEKAHVDIGSKVIEGDSLIEGDGPSGKLRGQNGFKIENQAEGKKRITLKGPSRIEIKGAKVKKRGPADAP